MKKIGVLLLCVLMLGLTACSLFEQYNDYEPFSASITIKETTPPTEVFFKTPVSTSPQFNPQTSVRFKDLKKLFCDTVFGDTNDTAVLWSKKIKYALTGDYTAEDADVIQEFMDNASQLSGFPGCEKVSVNEANVTIDFQPDRESISTKLDMDSSYNIIGATCAAPAGMVGDVLENTLNCLCMKVCGFRFSSFVDVESVCTSPSSATVASDLDWMLMEFMYDEIQPGMAKAECESAFDAYFKND